MLIENLILNSPVEIIYICYVFVILWIIYLCIKIYIFKCEAFFHTDTLTHISLRINIRVKFSSYSSAPLVRISLYQVISLYFLDIITPNMVS